MVAPFVLPAIPIITAIGRFAAPYLVKELGKIGANKFVKTYGDEAFTSLNETLANNTPMVNAEAMPMVNPNYKSQQESKPNIAAFAGDLAIPGYIAPDAAAIEREKEKFREMLKPVGSPIEPPEIPIKTGEAVIPDIDPVEEFPAEEKQLPRVPGFGEGDKINIPIITSMKDGKPTFKYPTEEEIKEYINEENKFWKENIEKANKENPQYSPKNMPQIVEADKHFGAAAYIFQNYDKSKLIYMSPDEYLSLTKEYRSEEGKESTSSKVRIKNLENILREGGELANIPILYIKKSEDTDTFEVVGQEGNHRAKAFKNLGYDKIPVVIEGSTREIRKKTKDIFPTNIFSFSNYNKDTERYEQYDSVSTKPTDFYDVLTKEKLFKADDVGTQTEKLLEPKVEFGPLTETEKQTAKALMGNQPEFFSRVAKSIKDAKPNKLTKNKWKSYIQGDKQELKFLGLDKFLQGNESITKQELLDFVEQANFASKLKVVAVPLEEQIDFTQFSLGGAGGKRAVSTQTQMQQIQPGYKSTVEQYVFQVDGPEQWSADPMHFKKKYATNAIGHARAQTGYFDADAVEKRLDAKKSDLSASGETRGEELSKYDETLKNASRQLEDTFIIDEIQSDMIQAIQKKGTKEDFIIIKGKDITSDFLQKNYPNYTVKKETNIIPGPGIFNERTGYGIFGIERDGPIAGLSETESTNKKILEDAQNFAVKNPSVLYVTDPVTGKSAPEVRLKSDKFYVFSKEKLIGRQSYDTEGDAQVRVEDIGLNPLPITESKKYVELILNAMIKKAVEKDLDSIGITNGQIQYDRYAGQPEEDKEGLKKFYDEIVFKQLEKVAKKYGVKLETVELPGKSEVKDFDDVGLNEPTEESDSLRISRRTSRAIRDGFVLRKVSYGTLANTIENINRGNIEGDPLPENAAIPDYASIFTETGRASGDMILDTLVSDNPDIENEKDYYMWVKPDSNIDKAISKANAGELMSLARAWDIRDINLQMPISAVKEIPEQAYGLGGDYTDYFSMIAEGTPNQSTSVAQYNYYIKNYFKDKEKFDIKYPHEIIKMKLPKKLQKDILSKPIKISKAKTQTDRLFA